MVAVPKSSGSPNSVSLFTATILVSAGFLLAVLIFPSFHWSQIAGVILLYSFGPFVLVVLDALKQGNPSLTRRSAPVALASSLYFLAVLAVQLRNWSEYFPKLSYERVDAGVGFHVDSAFHISLIQGILRTGYPTTGQHLDPHIPYHALTHYFDAGAILLMGLDPWGSYALLFFAKFIAILIAVVFFTVRTVSSRKSVSYFFGLFIITGTVLTATGHVVGSHSQWLPTLSMLLVANWTSNLLRQARPNGRSLVALSLVVVVLSLGKVSLGFVFAVFAGIILLIQNPRDFRIYLLGVSWALYFWLFAQTFQQATGERNLSILAESWAEIWTALLIVVVSAVLGWSIGNRNLQVFALSFFGLFMLLATGSLVFLTSPSDVFYFFFAAVVIGALFFPLNLAGVLEEHESGVKGESLTRGKGFRQIALLFSLLIVFGPVVAKAPFGPFRSGEAMAVDLVNSLLEVSSADDALEILPQSEALDLTDSSEQSRVPNRPPFHFRAMRKEVESLADSLGSENRPLLWLSSEDFSWLAEFAGAEPGWSTSLLVTAVTGEALLFGVPESPISLYGFGEYSSHDQQVSRRDFDSVAACSFGRPVIQTIDLEALSFKVLCN
jgi:hypothetical protein